MKVEKLIYKMLTEGTGEALCDSGGAYGRHWQKNQKRSFNDFNNDVEVEWDGDDYTISVYHYLANSLELNGICNTFNSQFKIMADWESNIYGVSAKAEKWLKDCHFEIKRSFNSYNGESALSQVIQGTWLDLAGKPYLLLQIHRGCDVRGGYTDAKLFYCPDESALIENVIGTITRKNGQYVNVDNLYNGYSLTSEDGKEIKITTDDKVELYLIER